MINPRFDSPITNTIFEIENMRNRYIHGSTPPWIFHDIKNIIYLMESVASARIEGNNTTLVSAAISSIENSEEEEIDEVKQFLNIRRGLDFIDETIKAGDDITLAIIRELHKIVVKNLPLNKDGAEHPGQLKTRDNRINKSAAKTTSYLKVKEELEDLLRAVNMREAPQFDIINIALAHHRFTLIHPFENGNGRVARLFTYAMLVQKGFIHNASVLNPSSIFCIDRRRYYEMLSVADKGIEAGDDSLLEEWCLYVAEGIKEEIKRTMQLLDKKEVVEKVILPTLKRAVEIKALSDEERQILEVAVKKDVIQARDVSMIFGGNSSANDRRRSRKLRELTDRGLLYYSKKKYALTLSRNKELLPILLTEMSNSGLIVME
ncbi:Fic family protein [Candidatus Saccharibacteria bacterium]|jgi:fic family protein|nr:Fic family protein [Candidatus Saccharibacteria bacterium]RKV95851.1 MAG: Fic family protein [Candidatus Saccharimonas sp.]